MEKTVDGRYRILQKIGEGGMGAVYLAQDLRLKRQVAVKRLVFQGKPSDEEMFRKRFEREAFAMASFQHPNIVSVFDFGQDDEGVYLVLEYMPGGSLSDQMRYRNFSLDESIRMTLPLADALQEIHSRGQVHRDIKPSNILFDPYGNPKLADFGVVKLLESNEGLTLTGTGVSVGTPAYMAPELIGGEASTATDQYALGVVLYELVTGKKPFMGRTPMETLTMHKYEPLPDPRSVNSELPYWICKVLEVSLQKEPHQRYGSIREFAEALRTSEGKKEPPSQAARYQEAETQAATHVPPVRRSTPISKPPVQQAVPVPQQLPPMQQNYPPVMQQPAARTPQPISQPASPPVKKRKKFPFWILFVILGVFGIIVVIGVVWLLGMMSQVAGPRATEIARMTEAAYALPTKAVTDTEEIRDTATPTITPSPTPSPTPELGIGSTLYRDRDGMEMVYVPEGSFLMGSDDGGDEEAPEHDVYLDAFWIDKYEITNQQFSAFVDATGYETDAEAKGSSWLFINEIWEETTGVNWRHPYGAATTINGLDDHPAVHMSWNDAAAYCDWVGAQLPTEAQWEKAARGTDGRLYPWGNLAPSCSLANYDTCVGSSAPVGSYPNNASPYGALDMAGNAWEWVIDWYDETYYAASPLENPTGPDSGESHVLRGGSQSYDDFYLHTTARISYFQNSSWYSTGFRCAVPAGN